MQRWCCGAHAAREDMLARRDHQTPHSGFQSWPAFLKKSPPSNLHGRRLIAIQHRLLPREHLLSRSSGRLARPSSWTGQPGQVRHHDWDCINSGDAHANSGEPPDFLTGPTAVPLLEGYMNRHFLPPSSCSFSSHRKLVSLLDFTGFIFLFYYCTLYPITAALLCFHLDCSLPYNL